MRERIHHYDVAKGLLILMVVFEHVSIIQHLYYPRNNPVFLFGESISVWMFTLFFMPAFFFIFGCYDVKNRPLGEEIKKNALRLLLPIPLLYSVMDTSIVAWFCWAMFFALALRNLLLRMKRKWIQYLILCALPFIGSFMALHEWNWHYLSHAFMLTPFIFVGKYLKPYLNNKLLIFLAFVVYAVSVVIFYKLYPIAASAHNPSITGTTFPTIKQLIISYAGGVSGTICLLAISRFIGTNKYLEFIGRNSLVFYLFHFNFLFVELMLLGRFIHSLQTPETYAVSACFYLLEFTVALVGCVGITKLINRYCPWVVGKGIY